MTRTAAEIIARFESECAHAPDYEGASICVGDLRVLVEAAKRANRDQFADGMAWWESLGPEERREWLKCSDSICEAYLKHLDANGPHGPQANGADEVTG